MRFIERYFEYFFITLVILILLIVESTKKYIECDKLPASYRNYKEARNTFSKVSFKIIDEADVFYSSLISAEYLSCDGETGYFIIETSKENFIYKNVPLQVWKDFKKSESKDVFFFNQVKGHFISCI